MSVTTVTVKPSERVVPDFENSKNVKTYDIPQGGYPMSLTGSNYVAIRDDASYNYRAFAFMNRSVSDVVIDFIGFEAPLGSDFVKGVTIQAGADYPGIFRELKTNNGNNFIDGQIISL